MPNQRLNPSGGSGCLSNQACLAAAGLAVPFGGKKTPGGCSRKSPEECAHHPHPGTHPVVMTGDADWGGWRVPGAEYDLHPQLVEHQARMVVNAPRMASLLNALVDKAKTESENMPESLAPLVTEARAILRYIDQEAPQ